MSSEEKTKYGSGKSVIRAGFIKITFVQALHVSVFLFLYFYCESLMNHHIPSPGFYILRHYFNREKYKWTITQWAQDSSDKDLAFLQCMPLPFININILSPLFIFRSPRNLNIGREQSNGKAHSLFSNCTNSPWRF